RFVVLVSAFAGGVGPEAERVLKTAVARNLPGLLADVPLAGHIRAIALCAEQLGNRGVVVGAERRERGSGVGRGLLRVEPGHDRDPRRAASRRDVEVSKPYALGRETIDARRARFASVRPEVRVTHVVEKDDQDV